jgi:hypothetical protein
MSVYDVIFSLNLGIQLPVSRHELHCEQMCPVTDIFADRPV